MTDRSDVTDLPARFWALGEALNAELVERSAEIDTALLTLVSGETCFWVGETGLAKSLLVARIAARISGVEFFDLTFDKFSTPDDVFGPRSLAAMQAGRWERETDRTLVTAQMAMLDEFFEANSAMLKALLRALNERTYRQGTQVLPMPLSVLFTASNEVPADPRLAALYDRLLIRRNVRRVQDHGSFVSMLETDIDERPPVLLAWSDVLRAQNEARQVRLLPETLDAVWRIRSGLADRGLFPADRRFKRSMGVVRAAAWLDGCTAADPDHLVCLGDVLWNRPDEIPAVAEVIDGVVEPFVSEADSLLRDVEDIRAQIDTRLTGRDRLKLANELDDKFKRAEKDFARLKERSSGNERQRRRLERLNTVLEDVGLAIMRDLFEIDVTELEAKRRRERRDQ